MARTLGIDYGKARIGIAISDERGIIATPLTYIKVHKSLEETAKEIFKFLSKFFPISLIVLGNPLLLSGKEGPMALEVKQFSQILEKVFSLPIKLWDERLTTAQAERSLREMKTTRKDFKKRTDSMAAAAILQNYLDANEHSFNNSGRSF